MSGNAVDIRPAREDEFETLAQIWDQSWISTGVESPEHLTLVQLADRLRAFRDAGAEVYSVAQEHTSIGLMVIDPAARKLSQVFLAPNAQGRGIGLKCIAFAQSRMPNGFNLTVAEQNDRAIAFYRRVGLVQDGRIYRDAYQRHDLIFRWPGANA